jgi:hypothetical protein
LGNQQALPNLAPGSQVNPGFDVIWGLTTRHQRFTHVRLLETHLTEYPSAFSNNAHHQGSLPSQLGVVWNLLLQADSGGPSPISDKAFTAHNLSPFLQILAARFGQLSECDNTMPLIWNDRSTATLSDSDLVPLFFLLRIGGRRALATVDHTDIRGSAVSRRHVRDPSGATFELDNAHRY